MHDHRGAIAIVSALSLVVLTICCGMAMDYGQAVNMRIRLQKAADAAVLAGAADAYATDGEIKARAASFIAAAANVSSGKTSVKRSNGTITIDIQLNLPTNFLRVAGITSIPITVTSAANSYVDDLEIHVAIDMSASLGLAADPPARTALKLLTKPYVSQDYWSAAPDGCEFACHLRDGWEPNGKSSFDMARAAGIRLREDVLVDAFGVFLDGILKPTDEAVASNHKRVALYGFSDSFVRLSDATNDTSRLKAALLKFPGTSRWNTRFDVALPALSSAIGKQSNGVGATRKMALLITDGLSWNRSATADNGPINTSLCDAIKSAGIPLAVVDVKYQDASGEYWFDAVLKSFYSQISPRLKACASPGMYFVAQDSDLASLAKVFNDLSEAWRSKIALRQ